MSLLFADAPPLNELGILGAAGVLFGSVWCLTLLPSALSINERTRGRSRSQLDTFVAKCGELADKKVTLWSTLAFCFVGLIGLPNLTLVDDYVGYFSKDTAFRQDADAIEASLASPNHIALDVTSLSGNLFEPEFLEELERLTHFLRSHNLVANAYSLSDTLLHLASIYPIETPDSETLEQLFLAYQLSLRAGQSVNDYVREDLGRTKIEVALRASTTLDIQNIKLEIEEFARNQLSTLAIKVTGENIPVAFLTSENAMSMITGLALAIIVAAGLISLTCGDWRLAPVSIAALSLPMTVAFGLWGLTKGNIGLAALVIISLNLGVVIDDAIHVITRFTRYLKNDGKTPTQACAYTVSRVGKALVTTTIVLSVGLLCLCSSDFLVNQQLGLISALILSLSLATDLIVLPAALRALYKP